MSTLWEMGAAGEMDLIFPAPRPPLSINAAHRLHWAKRRKETDPWRDMTWTVARGALAAYARTRDAWPVQAVTIQVALPFRDRRRRDPHNYTGTNVKAVVDGLVRAGVIPDDSPEWATILEPRLSIQSHKPPRQPLVARVTIRPRSNP